MTTTAVTPTPVAFIACDRCSARAAVEARLAAVGVELYLCQHHTDNHLPALEAKGWTIRKLT
jgi:hypothetical protein